MAAPIRVGILNDMSDKPAPPLNIEPWIRYAIDEVRAAGRLDRDVEFVRSWGLGMPPGTAVGVERAFMELVDQGCVLIVGPAIGDNAMIATPFADRERVPAIQWAGAERARSEYMFHLQVGSHEDESVVLANHIAGTGAKRVGVVYDRSVIGRRHMMYLQSEAEVVNLRIAAAAPIPPLATDATAEVDEILAAKPDTVLYFGLGEAVTAVARALKARAWGGPCVLNAAGLRGHYGDFAEVIDGWTYLDMYSDGNKTLAALCRRPNIPPGGPLVAAKGYDLGRLVAEGLARAQEFTHEGIKTGLEQIKWLPAAEGQEGTLLGFGIQDRGALHGRYLVVRQWRGRKSYEVT